MKKTLSLAICSVSIAVAMSCTNHIHPINPSAFQESQWVIDEKIAMKRFAELLSKVVTRDLSLREFLRDEALREFDRDYDVFYPFVKDTQIHDGKSFRDLLLDCLSDPAELELIERSVPKLTILVPDFSWIDPGCFSVKTWDTSIDEICVGYDNCGEEHPFFYNGEMAGHLKAGSFPGFPVLIVKSNERMRVVSSDTRTGSVRYDFVSPVFDANRYNDTRGYSVTIMDNPDTSYLECRDIVSIQQNFISASDLTAISPESIAAYNEFGSATGGGVQRDYIYYGMSQCDTSHGYLKHTERDLLYRFCFSGGSDITGASDHNSDPDLDQTVTPGKHASNQTYTFSRILNELWGTGQYEIRIDLFKGRANETSGLLQSMVFNIPPQKLMYISHIRDLYGWTALGNLRWHEYTVQPSYIQPKWYYPGDTGSFVTINTPWNLATYSDNIVIRVSEVDESASSSIQKTIPFYFASNISILPGTDSLIKFSFGTGSESSISSIYTYSLKSLEDVLGEGSFLYIDNIISNSEYSPVLGDGYNLTPVETGYFKLQFIPVDSLYYNSISQSLMNRL